MCTSLLNVTLSLNDAVANEAIEETSSDPVTLSDDVLPETYKLSVTNAII